MHPLQIDLHGTHGTCLSHAQEAGRLLQRVIEADAYNGHAWHTLGALDEEQGRLDSAAKAYANGQRSSGVSK